MTETATETQNRAAAPDQSTWLSANAGSGKTRVLTNRVARLLLHGVSPQNILCLTYTKAAAGEMQNRLFSTLGTWAMLADDKLRKALKDLGETPPDDLSKARTLFASAIEAPGGLKIQTIHSLCASILRQFPLEAGVSPQFREMDTPQQDALIEEVLEGLAETHAPVIERAAMLFDDSLMQLARNVSGMAECFEKRRGREAICATFGVPSNATDEWVLGQVFLGGEIAFLKSLIPLLRASGKSTDEKLADKLAGLSDPPGTAALRVLEDAFLTGGGANNPFSAKLIPTKDLRVSAQFAPLLPDLTELIERVERTRPLRVALEAARQTHAVEEFAHAFLPAYREAKQMACVLDFDDLIRHTRTLLTTQSMQWVMYRLDGRIDHILVDEAQDTSPAQWDVIEALAEEMASGEGDRPRTLFVVGDKKQSIYSFQGADAAGFDRRANSFAERLADGQGLRRDELLFSFRSSPAILSVVDRVFEDSGVRHKAFHDDMPGRVDLWPLVPRPDTADDLPWHETGHRSIGNAASVTLAEKVACEIEKLIESGSIPGENGPKRVEPGDIMVLVQRRSQIFDQIIQACKARGLDIAGADRLKIGSELAVRDLLALLSFLALPEDSLSLAAALRSPLFGWSEQQLFTLATGRDRNLPLWAALRRRREEFPETHAALTELRRRVDYLRPYELIETILTEFKGRVRLLERLGPEAEDGIDVLLSQALAYERDAVPSLTGFLDTARAADIEVKRQSDNSGNLIRVMTVHGAKGLESPIVILPDTTFSKPRASLDLIDADGLPVIPVADDKCPPNILAAKSAKKFSDAEERDRLLYVAMTRAEKWLIVCGVEPAPNAANVPNWHQKVREGLERAGAEPLDTDLGQGLRLAHATWPETPETPELETDIEVSPRLAPFGDLPTAPVRVKPISPSDMGGAKVLGGGAASEDEAKRRGRQVHLLLEHLAGSADAEKLSQSLLSTGPDAALPEQIPALLAEAQRAIEMNPAIFSADALAEVGIVANVPGLSAPILGTIDRLIVTDDSVLAVDFKTNAIVPDTPQQTPDGILRQMGAYLEALQLIYPNHRIDLAILWTATGTLMPLEHGIVRDALHATPTS